MQVYANKQALIDEITKRAKLFIDEFRSINNVDKDVFVNEVNKTPSQMVAYQLGWINLILSWEQDNKDGKNVITPTPNYKWNNLGELYQSFYDKYAEYSLETLIEIFNHDVNEIIQLVESYNDKELFEQGGRQWATSTPSSWPIWKWIHINTVAPFKTFRAKVRKWKKIRGI
ncbi:ClbS/DfsB family four-helix bundle protein [Evansella sp. AB-P1]|uniref:ClbS/DfsB family four-helix bundle protein n=1 Tax=Evansella sp. AB-P1 TaxID=3037653 RepID=UPI00241FCCD2|nr:ClbS/DfsB family four-helix bundle protein [Evansella sp. AB-P1]MDG5790151.1 ClbS/DfsB family four-helix bundle protein [Evansella sp. AB-P1]